MPERKIFDIHAYLIIPYVVMLYPYSIFRLSVMS